MAKKPLPAKLIQIRVAVMNNGYAIYASYERGNQDANPFDDHTENFIARNDDELNATINEILSKKVLP